MRRVSEVLDCWFDSGSMPFAQYHYPFENKDKFRKNFPSDFIAEGQDQTRGWFYTLHAINTFLFDKPAYKNLIVNGMILDKNGKKMSKSVGNVINPFNMMESYGADVLRWYLVASSPIGNSKLFNEEDLVEIQNKLFDTLINTVRFYVIYSNNSGFDYDKFEIIENDDREMIDRWLISKINSVKKLYFHYLDNYEITKAARLLYDFTLDELSNWYVRRNRKRFRNPADERDRLSGYQTLYEVLINLLQLIAPVSPFITEFLYGILTKENESIHLTEFTKVNANEIDKKLEDEMKSAQDLVYLIRSIRVKNNLKVRQPLKQVLIPVLSSREKSKIMSIRDIVLEEINVKEMNFIDENSNIIIKKAKPNFKSIGPKYGKDVNKVKELILNLDKSEISEIETNNKLSKDGFDITSEDIEIYTENIEGWLVETYNGLTVALDTTLDENLIEEGIIREFINRVQNFRRANDYEISDKVNIYIKTSDRIYSIIEKYKDIISDETLSDKIEFSNGRDYEYFNTEVNGEECKIYLQKI